MKKIIYLLAIATLILASCSVSDPIYETAYPHKGKIILTTDWTNRTEGVAIPASYTVRVGELSATISGTTNEYPHLVAAGNYTLYVYNTADKISVSGTTATVAMATIASVIEGAVEALPDWFFSAVKDITIAADADHNLTVPMVQQVREVNFTITPTGGSVSEIASVAATLEGVAGAIDLKTGAATGSAMSVSPLFTKQSNGDWTATIRLLDISGAVQRLNTKITFTGGTPADLEQSADVTTQFTSFATNKKTPLNLIADAIETQTEAGFTCTITDWETTPERPGTAN